MDCSEWVCRHISLPFDLRYSYFLVGFGCSYQLLSFTSCLRIFRLRCGSIPRPRLERKTSVPNFAFNDHVKYAVLAISIIYVNTIPHVLKKGEDGQVFDFVHLLGRIKPKIHAPVRTPQSRLVTRLSCCWFFQTISHGSTNIWAIACVS